MQLLAKGGILQFLITSIHGMPPQAALRAFARLPAAPDKGDAQAKPPPGGTAAAPSVPAGAVTRLPPTVDLTVGATLAATLLKGPAPAGAKSPAPGTPGNPPAMGPAGARRGPPRDKGRPRQRPPPAPRLRPGRRRQAFIKAAVRARGKPRRKEHRPRLRRLKEVWGQRRWPERAGCSVSA